MRGFMRFLLTLVAFGSMTLLSGCIGVVVEMSPPPPGVTPTSTPPASPSLAPSQPSATPVTSPMPSTPPPSLTATPPPAPTATPPATEAPDAGRNVAGASEPLATLGRGAVRGYAWSPDGERLAVAGPLGVHVYPADAAQPTNAILSDGMPEAAHHLATAAGALAVAYHPDGDALAATTQDGAVHIWDAASGALLRSWAGHGASGRAAGGRAAAYSPDGRWLATGADDGHVIVWQAATGELHLDIPTHPQSRFLWSADGRWLVVGGGKLNRQVQAWEVETGQLAGSQEIAPDLLAMTMSPASPLVAYADSDRSVTLWDLSTGETRALPDRGLVHGLAIAPDGGQLAVAEYDGEVTLWDLASLEVERVLAQATGWVRTVAYSPDGAALALADEAGLTVYDIAEGLPVQHIEGRTVGLARFAPDGRQVTFRRSATLVLLDVATGAVGVLAGHADLTGSLAASPDGDLLAVGDWGGLVHLWRVPAGEPYAVLDGHVGPVGHLAFSSDGALLATGGVNEDRSVLVWEVATAREAHAYRPEDDGALGLAFRPGEPLLALGIQGGVRLWDLASGATRELMGHDGGVLSVAWAPSGDRLLSGGFDGEVLIWDPAGGAVIGRLPAEHQLGAASLLFGPDGERLITGDQGQTVRVWAWPEAELLYTIEGRGGDLALGPDGALLAYKPTLDDVALWDLGQRAVLRQWPAGRPLAFDPRGRFLATGSAEGLVTLWAVGEP